MISWMTRAGGCHSNNVVGLAVLSHAHPWKHAQELKHLAQRKCLVSLFISRGSGCMGKCLSPGTRIAWVWISATAWFFGFGEDIQPLGHSLYSHLKNGNNDSTTSLVWCQDFFFFSR